MMASLIAPSSYVIILVHVATNFVPFVREYSLSCRSGHPPRPQRRSIRHHSSQGAVTACDGTVLTRILSYRLYPFPDCRYSIISVILTRAKDSNLFIYLLGTLPPLLNSVDLQAPSRHAQAVSRVEKLAVPTNAIRLLHSPLCHHLDQCRLYAV